MSDNDSQLPPLEGESASPAEPAQAPAPEVAPAPAPASTLPDDLRVPWSWMDVFIFVIFSMGLIVVLEYSLQTILLTSGRVKLKDMAAFISGNSVYVSVRQFLWFMSMLGFLFFTLRPRREGPFWETVGWREPRTGSLARSTFYPLCFLGGSVLAIFVGVASSFFAPKHALPIQQLFLDKQSIYLIATLAVFVAPIVEETIFRGFLYPVFARTLGVSVGILLAGTLFGLMHAQQLWGGWAQIGLLVLVGVIFTAMRARSGSVIPCFLLHLGYNAIQFVGFFFSAAFHKLPLVK
jgi:membrane protease YdiL (CAAX protease family)